MTRDAYEGGHRDACTGTHLGRTPSLNKPSAPCETTAPTRQTVAFPERPVRPDRFPVAGPAAAPPGPFSAEPCVMAEPPPGLRVPPLRELRRLAVKRRRALPTIVTEEDGRGNQWSRETADEGRFTVRDMFSYLDLGAEERARLGVPPRNVLSNEISGTALGNAIGRPQFVLDAEFPVPPRVWKRLRKRPMAMFLILTGQGSVTDFHQDPGGSAVWYHVVKGRKEFLVAPPTAQNLYKYEVGERRSPLRPTVPLALAHELEGVRRVVLREGETMFIPAGWVHAVVTPVDSVVVGGNFLCLCYARIQLAVDALEARAGTGPNLRFTGLVQAHVHAAERIVRAGADRVRLDMSEADREGAVAVAAELRATPKHAGLGSDLLQTLVAAGVPVPARVPPAAIGRDDLRWGNPRTRQGAALGPPEGRLSDAEALRAVRRSVVQ